MFQIVRLDPVYSSINDALIGSKAVRLPMAYHTEAFAHKLAGRLHDEDYRNCGDSSFVVVRYGESAFSKARYPAYQPAVDPYEMPF